MFRMLLLSLLACLLVACATTHLTPGQSSELAQGQRYFETGFYKHAMKELLPLACDGIAEAQYAVGYMYYYGFGVGQDTEVGRFWIERSASKGYEPARVALTRISQEEKAKPKDRYR